MADVDIAVDSGDLKAAIDLLQGYESAFIKMVNQVQTESNRLSRASKATSQEVSQAFDRMVDQIEKASSQSSRVQGMDTQKLQRELDQRSRLLVSSTNDWKKYFQDITKLSAGKAGDTAFADMLKQEAAEAAIAAKSMEESARKAAKATQEQAKEVSNLTLKYNPLLAAEQQYIKMQQEINRALDMNIIDTKQQVTALNQLEKEYNALNRGVYLAGSRFNQFGEMAGIAGKSANRFGMYAQQAGYQIGDFAVQIQSGANAGVAFSQQAAQLAGLIPGLAGAVTTFAAIGIGLGIQAITRLNEGGRKGKDIYEDLGSTLENLGNLRFDNLTGSLLASAQQIKQEFQATFDLIERVEMKALKQNLRQPLSEMEKALEGYQRRNSISNQLGSGDASFSFLGFSDPDRAIQAYQHLSQIQGETREELAASLELQTRYLQGSGLLTSELEARLATMAEELGIVEQVTEEIQTQTDIIANANKYYEQQKTELLATLQLEQVKKQYGEDSVQYLDAQLNSQLEQYRIQLAIEGVEANRANQLVMILKQTIEMEQATDRVRLTAETLYDQLYAITGLDLAGVFARADSVAGRLLGTVNAIGRGMAQVGRLGMEAQVLKAQNDALASGKSPAQARVAGDVVRYGQELDLPDGPLNNIARRMLTKAYESQALENLTYEEQFSEGTKAYNDARKPEKKGGGSKKGGKEKLTDAQKEAEKAKEKLEEFFKQYNKNIEQQERLLGVYGEQKKELEKVIEIENRLGEARHLVSQTQIEALAREEMALENKLQRQQEIFDIGSNNVENLLMTIVQGTESIEDAFKAMLSNIIAEVYQKYVAQGAADAVGGFAASLFSAKGNAFGASGVKMFAKGGVVDSPTAFNYSGGLGVMGEAGPEAIMPLQRNSQGELGVKVSGGSTGNVHVTQVFQIAASGDAAVKAIIRQETPKIAQAAKLAVLDAKRRNEKGFK